MNGEIAIESFEVFATGLDHPECVAFDQAGDLWAGGEKGQIYRVRPSGAAEQIAHLGGFTGGIAVSPTGDVFVCNPTLGVVQINPDGRHEVFASHAGIHKFVTPNFAVFDRAGSMYVTDSGQWKKGNGFLTRIGPNGKGEVLAGPFGYANGLALSADERTLFMVESNTDRVLSFAIAATDAGGKTLGPAQTVIDDAGRFPDGLALDEIGNLYVSCYASDDIHRVSLNGRRSLLAWDRHAILLSRPTNMAFGVSEGDRETMYVANLGRTTIVRAKLNVRGQRLASHGD